MTQAQNVTVKVLISNATEYTEILQFVKVMDYHTPEIAIANEMGAAFVNLKQSTYTRIYFYDQNHIQLDECTVHKKLNANTGQMTVYSSIILGVCIGITLIWAICYMLVKSGVEKYRSTNQKIKKVKLLGEEENEAL